MTSETTTEPPSSLQPDLLTVTEQHALDLTGQLARAVHAIISHGPGSDQDWREFVIHMHAIQHMIMSQAAARAYPQRYRLLGHA